MAGGSTVEAEAGVIVAEAGLIVAGAGVIAAAVGAIGPVGAGPIGTNISPNIARRATIPRKEFPKNS
jgi:hypothetical protein